MSAPYNPCLIADYMIHKGGGKFTKTHIIKMLSFAYGCYLVDRDKRLFHGGMEAWVYGPVIPMVYEALKEYDGPIKEMPYTKTPIGPSPRYEYEVDFINSSIDHEDKEFIDIIIEELGNLSREEMIYLEYNEKSAWKKCYVEGEYHTPITDEAIRKCYKRWTKK